jgi:hypothetical protein
MYKILVAVLVAAAAATSFRDRLKTIRDDAATQRDKLKLSRDQLYAQYPTPEMTFQGDAPKLACGQTSQVVLTGHFPKGTQLILHSDDAQLSDVKVTEASAKGTLRVGKNALPGRLEVEAVTPVSGASIFQRVAEIDEKLNISLVFEDGWTAKLTQVQDQIYTATWSKSGQTRTSTAGVHSQEGGGLHIELEGSPEQQAIANEQVKQAQAQMADPDMTALQKLFSDCEKQPKDAQMACMTKASAEAQVIGNRIKKKQEDQAAAAKDKQPKEAWACNKIDLRGAAGKLSGDAECAVAGQKVTATVACVPR